MLTLLPNGETIYLPVGSCVSNAREGAGPGLRDAFSRALVLRDAFSSPGLRSQSWKEEAYTGLHGGSGT